MESQTISLREYPPQQGDARSRRMVMYDNKNLETAIHSPSGLAQGNVKSQFHLTELNSQVGFVEKSRFPPFFKGENK
jgi:hypothetical protein